MPRAKSINFYKNKPKVVIFVKKYKTFERWWLCSQTPETSPPPFQVSGYAPDIKRELLMLPRLKILLWKFVELAN